MFRARVVYRIIEKKKKKNDEHDCQICLSCGEKTGRKKKRDSRMWTHTSQETGKRRRQQQVAEWAYFYTYFFSVRINSLVQRTRVHAPAPYLRLLAYGEGEKNKRETNGD